MLHTVEYIPSGILSNNTDDLLALTETFDGYLRNYDDFYKYFHSNLVDPMEMDEALLDWRAMQTLSPWSLLWDTDWTADAKRLLLRDEQIIFGKALFPETLTLLFSHFSLDAMVDYTSGFILSHTIPATLSNSIFEYRILAPRTYEKGTIERNILDFCVTNFGSPINVDVVLQ